MGCEAARLHDSSGAPGRGAYAQGPRLPTGRKRRTGVSPQSIAASHFSPDTQDFFRCLARHEVHYLIVGGEAVIYYGHARLTGDVDFFYSTAPENAERLFRALQDFWGGDVPGITDSAELTRDNLVVQFGLPPNRIDLLSTVEGISFDAAWQQRVEAQIEGAGEPIRVPFIGLADLIRNKAATGRPKDEEDLRYLRAAAAGTAGSAFENPV